MEFNEIAFRVYYQEPVIEYFFFHCLFYIFFKLFLSFFIFFIFFIKSITFFKIFKGFLLLLKGLYTLIYIINN